MVRFQADADFNQILVAALVRRVPDVDFRTAEIALLRGLTDAEVLALSAREGRILVTHDSKTMPRHFGEFVGSQSKSWRDRRATAPSRIGRGGRAPADLDGDVARRLDQPDRLSPALIQAEGVDIEDDPKAPCPCGSGRRYRKSCMRR